MKILVVFLFALPLAAQLTPFIDLTNGWTRDGVPVPLGAQKLDSYRNRLNPIGVYWLRQTVAIPTGTDTTALSLGVGTLNGTYEVYVNGQKIGSSGTFGEWNEPAPRSRIFRILPGIIQPGQPARVAIHVAYRHSVNHNQRLGRILIAGDQSARETVAYDVSSRRLDSVSNLLFCLGDLGLATLLFLVAWRVRESRSAIWLGLYFVSGALVPALVFSSAFFFFPDASLYGRLALSSLVLSAVSDTAFCLAYFRFRQPILWILLLPLAACSFFYYPIETLPALALSGWRLARGGPGGRIAAGAMVALSLARLAVTFRLLGGLNLQIGVMLFSYSAILRMILGMVVCLILVRRLLAEKTEKDRLAQELAAGRAVQQLLLKDVVGQSGEYRVDISYLPDREVGGDFYHIIAEEGALILLAGDVSGKGLKAAMKVSLIVGALRTARERQPARILKELNSSLIASGEGFVTCACARFERGGNWRLASAGHPAPYLKGKEVGVPGGLPLGISGDVDFDEIAGQIGPESQMTYLSDGVIEAANEKGELFGFDRTREVSGKSAGEIAEAAKAWGQNDDITVVTVRRNA